MSEIKGQMLGMVLVLAVFGMVAALIFDAFNRSAKRVESAMDNEESLVPGATPVALFEYQAVFLD